jgi:hypothetical protein
MLTIHNRAKETNILQTLSLHPFRFLRRRWKLVFFFSSILLVVLSLMITAFYFGAVAHRQQLIRGKFKAAVVDIISTNINIPINYVRSFFIPVETISIDAKFEDIQILYNLKDRALELEEIPDDFKEKTIKAKLKYRGNSYKSELNLYGRWLDHMNTQKFSIQVKLKGKQTILGMRKFSLMHPKVRYGIHEWVANKLLDYEGLISLKLDFINVVINGKNNGIYIIEEGFDKQLIERNQLKEGFIVKIEDGSENLKIYGESKALKDDQNKAKILYLKSLYRAYQLGNLPANKFFDFKKLATFRAIVDLIGGYHSLVPDNMRYYFNPITSKIEPIGREFESHPSAISTKQWNPFQLASFKDRNFSDPEFQRLYGVALTKISSRDYLDAFFKEYNQELQRTLAIIYKDDPSHYFSKDDLYKRQLILQENLNPKSSVLHAYYKKISNNKLRLFLRNENPLSAEAHQLIINDTQVIDIPENLLLMPSVPMESTQTLQKNYHKIDVDFGDALVPADPLLDIKLLFSIVGGSQNIAIQIIPWPGQAKYYPKFSLLTQPFEPQRFKFLKVDKVNNIISIEPGDWTIRSDLVIPSGYLFSIGPDVKLNLVNSAAIISYSPLKFLGTAQQPIQIYSSDHTGQGVSVLNAPHLSVLRFVHFKDMSAPHRSGWELTGAVTFYQSDVEMTDLIFNKNHAGDDLVNIIRSKFSISQTQFRNSIADALDVDFSEGLIKDSLFIYCGTEDGNGDCIDLSGSDIVIQGVEIRNAGDKSLSVGERSTVKLQNSSIKDSNIAIASKDLSIVNINQLLISSVNYGFVAYQKKSEFGPGEINSQNHSLTDVGLLHLIEKGSTLILDSEIINGAITGVKNKILPNPLTIN